MNDIIRCKECGRPISLDEQKNFLFLCYDCYNKLKSRKMGEAYRSKCCGWILLMIVIVSISIGTAILEFQDPDNTAIFIIVSIGAIIIPLYCIYNGYKEEKEWKNRTFD
ncbi:MAG: hypothetical protein ACFFDH_08765 [Promethearchaeota archaeon]